MDSRGIPIVVQTTKKAPTTPSRNPLTPKRHDIPSSPYVYTNLKDEKSLLDAYDSFADACFQSHYNHSMLTEDCRYNIHDLFKSDCYATENNTSSVPDSPKLNHSQNKRMRSTLTIDIDPAEAQVPTLETCKRLKADSSMFTKMDIVSSPIEATTPMGEDMEEALDTIMNTATLKQQKHQEGFTTEEESNKANTILTTTMKEAILHNSTYSVEQLNNQEGSVTLKTSSTDHKMDTPEKSSPDIDNCVQIDPIADSSKKSAVVEVLKVVAKVPADPVTKDPGTTTKTSVKEGPSTPTKESVKKDPDTPTKKPAVTRRVTRSQIKDKKIEFAVPELPRSRKKASPKKKKTPETSTKEADEPVVSQTEKISNQTVAPIETKVKEADEPVVSQTEEISNQTVAPIETKVKESEVKTELSNEEVERRKYEAQKKEKIKKEIRNLLERFPSLADYYQLIDRTGCGTFSKVYKAKDLRADQYVALDQNSACQQEQGSEHVAIKLILDISTPERVANEIQCLLLLRSLPGITNLITAFRKESLTFLILPYVEFDHFESFYADMTLSDTRSYVSELLTGLQSAHQTGIMHRDVKPGNFLYSKKTKRGYLADFGLAQQSSLELYTPKHNSQLSDSQIEYTQDQAGYYHNDSRPPLQADRSGTKGFRAPEVMMRFKYQTTAVDIWAVGVILLIILSGRYPFFEPEDDADGIIELAHVFGLKKMVEFSQFYGRTFRTNIPSIPDQELDFEPYFKKINPDHVEKWDPGEYKLAIDLMKKCLQLIHTNRISATEALSHPFFQTKNEV